MARFGLGSGLGEITPIAGDLATAPPGFSVPDLSVGLDKEAGDYQTQLARLARERQAKTGNSDAAALILQPLEALGGLAVTSLEPLLSPAELLLQEAKKLIKLEKLAAALAPLAKLLRESPRHPEALYLQAFCQFRLEKPEEALRSLFPLQELGFKGTQASRVKALRSEIRQAMVPSEVLRNLLLTRSGRPAEAIDRLRELVALDPEAGLYHYMLAGDLMMAERLPEALVTVEEGLRHSQREEQSLLQDLRRQIERCDLENRLQPARRHYRDGNYPRARSAIQRIAPQYRESPLYPTFSGYLEALGGGLFGLISGKSVYEVKPAGRFADVDALYFFLVGEEVRHGRDCLERGDFGEAGKLLGDALRHAPYFPYANYLMGVCLYQLTSHSMAQGLLDLEEVLSQLETARHHAELGAGDPEIRNASDLLKAIGKAHGLTVSIRDELRARREEASRVNAAIEELHSIQEMAKGGIGSSAQYREVRRRLEALRENVRRVRKTVRSDEGRKALDELSDAVDRHWEQIQKIDGDGLDDVPQVNEVLLEFQRLMSGVEGGIRSEQQLRQFTSEMKKFRDKVKALERKVRSSDGTKALQNLSGAIDNVLAQLPG